MSDLSMYELEDIIWDEFDRGDDHIVPHPTNARSSRNSSEGDRCKKLRRDTTPVLSNTGNLDKDSEPLNKKKKMMEKESHSPSHAPHGVFNGSCDGEIVKDMPNLAFDDIRLSDDCFKSSYATSATGDNSSYSFVDNNCENKESGDLLFYGWPDVGNFEDVDKMLRSCDSSFGLGVTNNGDELHWFTSDQIENTEEALKMDFKFPCPELSDLKNILHPDHDSHRSSCISESKDEMRSNDNRLSSNNTSSGNRQQYKNPELDYFGHMQNTSYIPRDYLHQTTAVPKLSEEFQPLFVGSPRQMGAMFQSSKHVLVSDEKQDRNRLSVKEDGSQRGIERDQKGQEGSSVSSPEAISFRQLRQAMEQLDLRTKLCIRDSLYRLARSAEQRHNNLSLSSGVADVNDLGGPSMSERTSKCSGFMDMETDTNPIDRSVAHLLFHRPSESPNLPIPFPTKSNLDNGHVSGQSITSL